MITLKGQQEKYYFNPAKPLKKPGKFSTVFKGISDCGQSFLIKKLSEHNTQNHYESKIKHPSFVKSIERIEDGNHVYIVRPFVEGVGLNELKNINWLASEKKIVFLKRIISEISDALASLHAQQLLHGDIRPQNIIVNESNETNNAVVSIIDLDTVRPFYSTDVIQYFPLIYASPELVFKKNNTIDSRTDIYALAITLYEVIFNKTPFANSNGELIMHLMINTRLECPNRKHIQLVDVLNKAANKHLFSVPPATLDSKHAEEMLLSGRDSRYSNVETFTSELLNTINYSNTSWISRLAQFFQS